MKIIFLDIDGVLNTEATFFDDNRYNFIEIDNFRLGYLKKIVDTTGAKIVLTSAWKNYFCKKDGNFIPLNDDARELLYLFNKYGLYFYDFVSSVRDGVRQDEIWSWLAKNNDVDGFVVLDDDSSVLTDFVDTNLIKTSNTLDGEVITDMSKWIGLCEEHIEEAISILNNNYVKRHVKKK